MNQTVTVKVRSGKNHKFDGNKQVACPHCNVTCKAKRLALHVCPKAPK